MVKEGVDQGKAARIAQSKTGLALATGKPPRHGKKHPNDGHVARGDRPHKQPYK